MFKILKKPEGSKLAELSLKQKEMYLNYQADKADQANKQPMLTIPFSFNDKLRSTELTPCRLPLTPFNSPKLY